MRNPLKATTPDGVFKIDFFELMFLAESVIPPRPIARSMCFDDLSEKHYDLMTDNQRQQFFEHVIKLHSFNLENQQCRHFYARFNPKNQFKVTCIYLGVEEVVNCYLYNEQYHKSMNTYISPEYIQEVVRVHDGETIPPIKQENL
jgi:hypothetical protein